MSFTLRFKGFALIINTLLPFLLGVALILFLVIVIDRLHADFQTPVSDAYDDLEMAVTEAQAGLRQVAKAATAVQSEMAKANTAIDALVKPLEDFDITLPPLVIAVPTGIQCDPIKISAPSGTAPALRDLPVQARIYKAQSPFEAIGNAASGAGRAIGRAATDVGRDIDRAARDVGTAVDETIEDVGEVADDIRDGIAPGATIPPIDAPRLPSPPLGGLASPAPLDELCRISTVGFDVATALMAPLNDELEKAFAAPRAHIGTINTSITAARAEVHAVIHAVEEFPVTHDVLRRHRDTFRMAGSAFLDDVTGLLKIGMSMLVGILVWAALSLSGWLVSRLMLGWYLMRRGTYP